ncbi:MAG: tetratricopeptide repeat protein [Bacteroidota bacterium]
MKKPNERTILLWAILLLSFPSFGQSLDSILNVAKHAASDSLKALAWARASDLVIRKDKDEALGYALQSKAFALRSTAKTVKAKSFLTIGRLYHMKGQLDSAKFYYEIALPFARQHKSKGAIFNNLGALMRGKGNYEKAQEYYISSLQSFMEIDDKESIRRAYYNLGILNASVGNYDKALDFYLKNLAATKDLGDSVSIANAYKGLGDIYWYLKYYDKSVDAYEQAAICLKDKSMDILASILIGLGNCAAMKGQMVKAEKLFLESKEIIIDEKDPESLAQVYINLGSVRDSLGKYNTAYANYRSAYEISKEIGLKSKLKDAYGGMAETLQKLGRYQEAYYMFKKYHELQDTLLNRENLRQIKELQLKFDEEKANTEIARLEADNAGQEAALLRQQRLNGVLLAGSLGLLIIIVFLFGYYRYLQKQKEIAHEKAKSEQLRQVNKATMKFVPEAFLKSLGYESIMDVRLGDQMEATGTILFSDIRGYTSISEGMTPEENFKFLNAYLGKVGPLITQHNGYINQFLGDGIMALFPNDADDALRSAIDMCVNLHHYNEQRQQLGRQLIKIGIGLHTGEMMLGIIGDNEKLDMGIVSDTVNTSSRIEGLTKYFGASIIFSENTYRLLKNPSSFGIRPIGRVVLKGKSESISIYECFDGDLPAIAALKLNTLAQFKEGVNLYFQKKLSAAQDIFIEVERQNPDDRVAKFFVDKIKQLMQQEMDASWTGVEVMAEK